MIKTTKIQKSKTIYLNIPKDISNFMELEKGETALIETLDKNTMQIKIDKIE